MRIEVIDLGQATYAEAYAIQQQRLEQVVEGAQPSALFLVEHPPVLTLGANFHEENLLLSPDEYRARGIDVVRTDRGGDVTYHGPGQLVAYPIVNLAERGKDLHQYLRDLEEVVIWALNEYELDGYRFPPNTGVWVNQRKICAIGIKVRRWVSMHGLALNCDVDLEPFGLIVPCGIRGHGVTSLTAEGCLGATVSDAKTVLAEGFARHFA